jgi:hypothetical protein
MAVIEIEDRRRRNRSQLPRVDPQGLRLKAPAGGLSDELIESTPGLVQLDPTLRIRVGCLHAEHPEGVSQRRRTAVVEALLANPVAHLVKARASPRRQQSPGGILPGR